jgi:hypothetical protein
VTSPLVALVGGPRDGITLTWPASGDHIAVATGVDPTTWPVYVLSGAVAAFDGFTSATHLRDGGAS